jgi:hypothetical protein
MIYGFTSPTAFMHKMIRQRNGSRSGYALPEISTQRGAGKSAISGTGYKPSAF